MHNGSHFIDKSPQISITKVWISDDLAINLQQYLIPEISNRFDCFNIKDPDIDAHQVIGIMTR